MKIFILLSVVCVAAFSLGAGSMKSSASTQINSTEIRKNSDGGYTFKKSFERFPGYSSKKKQFVYIVDDSDGDMSAKHVRFKFVDVKSLTIVMEKSLAIGNDESTIKGDKNLFDLIDQITGLSFDQLKFVGRVA